MTRRADERRPSAAAAAAAGCRRPPIAFVVVVVATAVLQLLVAPCAAKQGTVVSVRSVTQSCTVIARAHYTPVVTVVLATNSNN